MAAAVCCADAYYGGDGFDGDHQTGVGDRQADIFLSFEEIEEIPLAVQGKVAVAGTEAWTEIQPFSFSFPAAVRIG